MKIKFYLNSSSVESALRVSIYKNKNQQVKITTNYSIHKRFWDQKKQRARKNMIGYEEFNAILFDFKNDLSKQVNKLILMKYDWEVIKSNIKNYLKTGNLAPQNNELLTSVIDKFLEDRKFEYRYETRRKYIILKKLITDYESVYGLTMIASNLDYLTIESFRKYVLYDRNNRNDTAYRMIASIKCVIRWANKKNYRIDESALRVKQHVKSKYEIVTLSEVEIEQIATATLTPEQHRIRDCFLFQIYTGQRFSDMQQLSPEQVQDHIWRFISVKTDKLMHVPFIGWSSPAEEIAMKYNYKFPQYTSQYYNRALKLICKNAGIDTQVQLTRYQGSRKIIIDKPKHKLISSHTARRTAVSLLLAKGMPPTVVMKLTGHTDIKTMMKYERTTTEALENALMQI